MHISLPSAHQVNPREVAMRCPACRHHGVFEPLGIPDLQCEHGFLGHRRCPSRKCLTHVFVLLSFGGELLIAYPPARLDFDATNLPEPVETAFEEALACHSSGAYVPAAMMVRKALECLCADRGAEGNTLHERLRALRSRVTLPDALFNAMGALKLLGNDAAHVVAKTYDAIGQEEVEAAIDVAKEILKAVYQYEALLGRLTRLAKSEAAK
jgi:hypothetical protein